MGGEQRFNVTAVQLLASLSLLNATGSPSNSRVDPTNWGNAMLNDPTSERLVGMQCHEIAQLRFPKLGVFSFKNFFLTG